ncbi:insulinase family protein [Candidatus Woesearchaeota archaeon]|nr:MAG: insulinase family protein [Candidatus Woesearchaeota archaeon]
MDYYHFIWPNDTNVYVIQDEDYKTTDINLTFFTELGTSCLAKTLANHILLEGSRKYPSSQKIELAFLKEFDVNYWAFPSIYRNLHSFGFSLNIVTERSLIGRKKTLEKSIRILEDIVTNPLIEGSCFSNENFFRVKERLYLGLKQNQMNKEKVAINNFFKQIIKNQEVLTPLYGTEEEYSRITCQDCTTAYTSILNDSLKHFYITTNLDPDNVNNLLLEHFGNLSRSNQNISYRYIPANKTNVRLHEDNSQFNQTIVIVGAPLTKQLSYNEGIRLRLLNHYLGGSSSSRIFKEVRQKRNMAYSAYSYLDTEKEVIYAMAGVDLINKQKTIDVMLREFEKIRSGKFIKKEIKESKKMLENFWQMSSHKKSQKLRQLIYASLSNQWEIMNNYDNPYKNVSLDEVIDASRFIENQPVIYCLLQK